MKAKARSDGPRSARGASAATGSDGPQLRGRATREGRSARADTRAGHSPQTDTRSGHSPQTDTRAGHSPQTDTRAGHSPQTDTRAGHSPLTDRRAGHTPQTDTRAGHSPQTDRRAGHSPQTDVRVSLAQRVARAPALRWVALLAVSCVPPPLDETGRRCSQDRPCSEDYFCVDGRCSVDAATPDAGTDAGVDAGLDAGADAGLDGGSDAGFDAGVPVDVNLLQNPGFEELTADGGVRAWRATNNAALVTAPQGKSGQRAGKIVPAPFDFMGLQPTTEPVKGAEQGQLYCARLYVKSNLTRPFTAVLQIRDRDSFGAYQSSNGTQLNVADGGWVSIEESYSSLGLGRLDIRLSSSGRADAGETFLVDDALLFRSSKSVCVFP